MGRLEGKAFLYHKKMHEYNQLVVSGNRYAILLVYKTEKGTDWRKGGGMTA